MPRHSSGRSGSRIIAALDIGTSKVCCLVAEVAVPRPGGPTRRTAVRVLGVGHHRAQGVKAGVIVDLGEAEAAVRMAVSEAERTAGVTLNGVYLGVACGRLRSQHFSAHAKIETGMVRASDRDRVLAAGRAYPQRDGRTLIHLNRIGYRLDNITAVRDPRGMAARRLSVDLHAVTVDEAPLRSLLLLMERCHLATAGLVAAPYASALATLTAEERRLGCACLDIGGGTSIVAVFADGHFLYADSVAVGGNHLTLDVAQAYGTPLAEAERMKTLHGTLAAAASDDGDIITYPSAGSAEPVLQRTTRADLRSALRPRVDSLLGVVLERLERSGMTGYANNRFVLTGGTSELVGFGAYVASLVGDQVRTASPHPIAGMPASLAGPAFSKVVGLLSAAASPDAQLYVFQMRQRRKARFLDQMRHWLRESL